MRAQGPACPVVMSGTSKQPDSRVSHRARLQGKHTLRQAAYPPPREGLVVAVVHPLAAQRRPVPRSSASVMPGASRLGPAGGCLEGLACARLLGHGGREWRFLRSHLPSGRPPPWSLFYAFAVQQTVTAPLGGRTKWWMNAAVSLSVVVTLSAQSWHGVVKPALPLKDEPSARR